MLLAPQIKAQEAYSRFISLCLQGRGAEALAANLKIDLKNLTGRSRRIAERFRRRFTGAVPPLRKGDSLPALLSVYKNYWHRAFLDSKNEKKFERELWLGVRAWLERASGRPSPAGRKATEYALRKELSKRGYYSLIGHVKPFRELELWREEDTVNFQVLLPEGRGRAPVRMLSQFKCKGWMAYATAGRYYPGGWAKKSALFCNADAYDLESERFRVSYLAHEAQHFSDYRRFPGLGQPELEYRAKLAELALSERRTMPLLKSFVDQADKNRRSPHALASHRLAADLAEATGADFTSGLDMRKKDRYLASAIKKAATLLLKKDSRRLLALRRRSKT